MPRPIAVSLALIVWTLSTASAQAAHAAQLPNILWLSVEDMSPWLACYGDKTAPTPNIDRLAREGVRYANAFATTPVCAPARHTIITGMYATSTGAMHMRNNAPSKQALVRDPHAYDDIPVYEAVPPPAVRCFPDYLRMAGWYATNNAKTDYQFVPPPTVWDESSRQAHWRNRTSGQPFFAVFNCNFTHESQAFPNAPKRADVVKPADVKVPPYYPDTPVVRQTLAHTYNNIVAMDRWVGERLAELEKDGLLDSTVVMFFSDHGVGLPRGKRSVYDSGLRVPLIVRFPGGKGAGTTDQRLVSFIDWAPTVLSLANVKPPAYMRGTPFLPDQEKVPDPLKKGSGTFSGSRTAAGEAPRYVFATADRMDIVKDTVRAVSDGRYKYIRNLSRSIGHLPPLAYRDELAMMRDIFALRTGGQVSPAQWQLVSDAKPREEFYDTRQDPHEVHNAIGEPQHDARVRAMREALDRWIVETGDLGTIQPETKLVKEKLWPPDGVQPTTATPRATLAPAGEGRVTLTITCETDGASIGYRRHGEPSWSIYSNPIEIDAAAYEVVAHRIGFRRSPIETLSPRQ